MGVDEKQFHSVVTVSNDNVKRNADTEAERSKPRNNRRFYIIVGVVIVVVIIALIAIIVPVVVTQTKKTESSVKKNECGPFSYPGVNISTLTPRIISHRFTCPLRGDCWTGEQCYQCFKLPKWKVGNINNIPVCCESCEISGLEISNSHCKCLHNAG